MHTFGKFINISTMYVVYILNNAIYYAIYYGYEHKYITTYNIKGSLINAHS